jgi:nicotinate-nucleotide adenylyltransferase
MVPLKDRRDMVRLNFAGLDRVDIDTTDLDNEAFTPTYALDERLKREYPDYQVWHAVGGDLVIGGRTEQSEIQRTWKKGMEIWSKLNFAVMLRPGFQLVPEDLPPSSELIQMEGLPGSSTLVRERIAKGEDVSMYLMPQVAEYIKQNGLYGAQ